MTGDQDSDLEDQPPKKTPTYNFQLKYKLYFNWKFALITMKILTRMMKMMIRIMTVTIRIMMMMMTNLCCLEISLNLPPLLLLIVLLPPLPGQVIGVFKKLKLLTSKRNKVNFSTQGSQLGQK